jgi:ParB-like chromosome segregation protein Spo0J
MRKKDQKDFYPMVEEWDTTQVTPYPTNVKEHPDEQVSKIAGAIKEFGWDQPIVVDGEGVIIKGHGRLLAAQRLGIQKVPVVVRRDLTAAQARAARISDNKVAEAPWDQAALWVEMERLREEDFDLSLTGFSEKELAALDPDKLGDGSGEDAPQDDINEVWGVMISCRNEDEQASLLEELTQRGLDAKALIV